MGNNNESKGKQRNPIATKTAVVAKNVVITAAKRPKRHHQKVLPIIFLRLRLPPFLLHRSEKKQPSSIKTTRSQPKTTTRKNRQKTIISPQRMARLIVSRQHIRMILS